MNATSTGIVVSRHIVSSSDGGLRQNPRNAELSTALIRLDRQVRHASTLTRDYWKTTLKVQKWMGKKRLPPELEESLVATIIDSKLSYYIGQHKYEAPIDDEAITMLTCEIVSLDARHKQHVGHGIEISLVCACRYSKEWEERERPSLFYMHLRKNQRSVPCYLPASAYWSLPALLTHTTDPCVEVSFERLHRGTGFLRSLWIGSYEQLIENHAAIAQHTGAR